MKQALSSKAIAQLKATDKAYIVFDSSQESPVGFGIRVTPNGTKTYLVKRRFRDSSSIKTLTIGKTRDVELDKARALARKWIADYEAHGEVRGETQRTLAQWTLKEVMDAYVEDLSRRKRGSFVPLDPSQDGQAQALCENTASSIASARKRLALWDKTTLKDLTINKVLTEFDRQRTLHPTAAEKAFTWAKSAVDLALEREREETSTPSVHFNPFASKSVRSLYRSRTQLREHYRQSKVANPLTGEDEIKKFLTVTWSRRERRTTAVDYLLTTLFYGLRASETSRLTWKDRLDPNGPLLSYVDLHAEIPYLYIRKPKNRMDHQLPLTPAFISLMKHRHRLSDSMWVFPKVSPQAKLPFFNDAKTLLASINKEAGIDVLKRHDLRRTFGSAAEIKANIPRQSVKVLLNHSETEVTDRYVTRSLKDLLELVEKTQDTLFNAAPEIKQNLLNLQGQA